MCINVCAYTHVHARVCVCLKKSSARTGCRRQLNVHILLVSGGRMQPALEDGRQSHRLTLHPAHIQYAGVQVRGAHVQRGKVLCRRGGGGWDGV